MRKPRVALFVAAFLALAIGLVFVGGQVVGCLGPLNVTHVQCIAAFSAAYDPDYTPGPAAGAWIVASVALGLAALAVAPWRRPTVGAVMAIAALGIAGALVGSVVHDLTRQTSLTGPTSSGEVITVAFGPNTEARLLDAAIGFGAALVGLAIAARMRRRGLPHTPDHDIRVTVGA